MAHHAVGRGDRNSGGQCCCLLSRKEQCRTSMRLRRFISPAPATSQLPSLHDSWAPSGPRTHERETHCSCWCPSTENHLFTELRWAGLPTSTQNPSSASVWLTISSLSSGGGCATKYESHPLLHFYWTVAHVLQIMSKFPGSVSTWLPRSPTKLTNRSPSRDISSHPHSLNGTELG